MDLLYTRQNIQLSRSVIFCCRIICVCLFSFFPRRRCVYEHRGTQQLLESRLDKSKNAPSLPFSLCFLNVYALPGEQRKVELRACAWNIKWKRSGAPARASYNMPARREKCKIARKRAGKYFWKGYEPLLFLGNSPKREILLCMCICTLCEGWGLLTRVE